MKDKKKKIILIVAIVAVIIIALVLGLFVLKKNSDSKKEEKITAIITLDINPSFELDIQDNKVNRINPLNEEAWELIDRKFEGEPLEDVLQEIVVNAREKGYMEDEHLSIILGMEKNDKRIEDKLREICDQQHIPVEIIVPEITEEAKKEAEGYGVTPAKAAYILSILKDNQELNFDDLKDKSVIELHEMKESGHWCDHDYTLRGNFCEKVIREEKPQEGYKCPDGTYEYNGKCYEEEPSEETDKYTCPDGTTLRDKNCINTISKAAIADKYSCNTGTAKTKAELGLTPANAGDAKEVLCVDESTITHPITPCEAGKAGDGTEYLESGGKCYWHRAPVIDTGCPGKIQVGGDCWDDATGIYICLGHRDGDRYSNRDAICPGYKYTNPVVSSYKCESGYTLNGDKCTKEESSPAMKERVCPKGFTKVDGERCINESNTVEKEKGLTCPEEARLVEERCVFYESVEAHGI